MKILFSITYYHPYVSGLTIYAKRMAELLTTRGGHDVSVLSFRHDPSLPVRETVNGVAVYRVPPQVKLSKGFLSVHWLSESWKCVRNANTVVIHLPQFEGWITALMARLSGKRVISVYHCEINLPPGNWMIQKVLELANYSSLVLSHAIVTYTRDYAEHSRLLKPFLAKTVDFYPPVFLPRQDAGIRKLIDAKIGKRNVTIGISARLAKEKGVEYLFAAIPLIQQGLSGKKIKIAIAGPTDPVGEEEYRREMLALAEKHADHIVFLGSLGQQEIGSFYELLDVLVLPSTNSTEAFGMVQVEAMLSGVPVVASDLPGVRVPIRRTGMGILVPVADSSALAEAIVTVIKNKKRYSTPKREIEKEFALRKTVEKFERMVEP